MGALHQLPRLRFRGATAGRVRVAVLALNRVPSVTLRLAERWSEANGRSILRVAVDGGLRGWRRLGRKCDLFVGDADSARAPRDVESVSYPSDKTFSDLAGALGEAARRRCRIACVAGVAGGRWDHELANLLELAVAAREFAGIVAPTTRGWVVVTRSWVTVETLAGHPFSLFAPHGRLDCDLHGPRWPLTGATVAPGSGGLSNVSGKRLRLVAHHGVAMLVFPP